jgi:hypothetical protein
MRNKTNLTIVKTILLGVTLLFLFFLNPAALAYQPAEGQISIITGPIIYQTHQTLNSDLFKAPVKGGLGLIVLGDINEYAAIEVELLLMRKNYYRRDQNFYASEETDAAHLALGYRRYFSSYFSGALDFYSSYAAGDPVTNYNDSNPTQPLDTSAHDLTEYGFEASLMGEIFTINNKWAFISDLRYAKSITSKSDENGDHFSFMIGIRYLLQEKTPSDNLPE